MSILADGCSQCAVDQPSDEPIIRRELADCRVDAPRPAPQRADGEGDHPG
jgi:hypothetical protein